MTEEMANAFDEFSPDEIEIRDDYSGRAMYGELTHAVCFESAGDFQQALAAVALAIGSDMGEVEGTGVVSPVYLDQLQRLADELRKGFQIDSMGLGIVVY